MSFFNNVTFHCHQIVRNSEWLEQVSMHMPVANATELARWLNAVPTHTMSDEDYTDFTEFKRRLNAVIPDGD
jgi:hypothetical protein